VDEAAGADAAGALRVVGEYGAFFVVAEATGADWFPYNDLLEDDSHRRSSVAAARAMLAERAQVAVSAIDERATASIQHLGTVARLVSPLLAVAAAYGQAPRLSTTTVRWRALAGGPLEFAMLPDGFMPIEDVLTVIVEPLGAAFASTWHLSPHIIRGNVASALAGAAKMLGQARPQLRADGERIARALLAKPSLHDAGSWPADGEFRRNNCCLFYRIPGAGTCGDCVLTAPISRR